MNKPPTQKFLATLVARFHRDQRGTTLTEFVITLPVIILIFAGIVNLGKLSRTSVRVWAVAHANAFDSYQDVQNVTEDELLGEQSSGLDERQDSVMVPSSAAYSATDQLREYPVAQRSQALRMAVQAAELRTYTGGAGFLGLHGHWGESVGRMSPLRRLAGFRVPGVDDAITYQTAPLVGNPNDGGSRLARVLVYDGVGSLSSGNAGCGNDLQAKVSGQLNDLMTGAGVRPMLGASMQYGTITGPEASETVEAGRFQPFEISAYYNVSVPPRTLKPRWLQPALSTLVTRFALEDCSLAPYSQLLGIHRDKQPLPNASTWGIEVPDPNEAGLAFPFDYGRPSAPDLDTE